MTTFSKILVAVAAAAALGATVNSAFAHSHGGYRPSYGGYHQYLRQLSAILRQLSTFLRLQRL